MAGKSLERARGRGFMYVGVCACMHICVYTCMYVMYVIICNCSNCSECLLCAVLIKWYRKCCYCYCYCSIACDGCNRTLVACRTIRFVKGFLSFNPLAFTHVPPDVTTSKLCEDSIIGYSVWQCVRKMYGSFRWRDYRLSIMLWAFFSHGNLSLFMEF